MYLYYFIFYYILRKIYILSNYLTPIKAYCMLCVCRQRSARKIS